MSGADVSTVAFVLKHLVVLALIASTALALGLPWLRRLSVGTPERAAMAVAVGLAMGGQLALGLGLAGGLVWPAIITLVVLAHALAWRDLRDLVSHAGLRVRWRGAGIGVLALAPIVACALYPPLGFDETMYHLPYVRAFARTGGLPFLPDLRFPIFPQLVEGVFTAVFVVAGDVATHGVSLVAHLATALLLFAWAGRGMAGGLAAAFWLGQPLGVYLAGTAYVEPALALFAAAAIRASDQWRADGRRRWLVLAGLLSGSAASSKYLGLLVVAGVAGEITIAAGRRLRARDVAAYAGPLLAAMAVSYGRLLYHTGSPVFPFAPGIFGVTPWDTTGLLRPLGIQLGPGFLRLPWDFVFNRAVVGDLPPASPLLIPAVPLTLVVAAWNRPVRRWVVWAVGFVLISPVGAHYHWTIAPLVALAAATAAAEVFDRLRPCPSAWLILCLLPGWLYGGYQLVRLGPIPADGEARHAFLAVQRPLFPAVSFVNDRCGERCVVYAAHSESMVYYATGRFLGDWNGPASFRRTLPVPPDPGLLLERLRRLGVQYLLVPRPVRGETGLSGADAPGFRRVYSDAAADVYEVAPPEAGGAESRARAP